MGNVRGRLRRAGVRRDDAVAVVLPNEPAMAIAFLGVASGAACAPLNPAYREAELQASFDDLRPAALVTDGCSPESEAVARARGVAVLAPLAAAEVPIADDDRPAPDDVALLLHTSGTTSRPKRVPLTHANLCASAANVAATLALGSADRCLNVMPLFHIHGLVAALLASLHAGGSVVCTPGFEPTASCPPPGGWGAPGTRPCRRSTRRSWRRRGPRRRVRGPASGSSARRRLRSRRRSRPSSRPCSTSRSSRRTA